MKTSSWFLSCICAGVLMSPLNADESLLGITKSAEPLPMNAIDFVQHIDHHGDKGAGRYSGIYTKTELEYGVTDKFTVSGYLLGQSVTSKGILVDGYIPADHSGGWGISGFEASMKYNFLSTAKDEFGLSQYLSYRHLTKDPHSGQDKDVDTVELKLLAQKYFLDGQLIWLGNLGLETTRAQRKAVNTAVDWPTTPEMEIGLMASTGLSYRFINNWYIGAEAVYEQENETEIGLERFSYYAGPTLHYGSQKWWTSISYLRELKGGGEKFDEQNDPSLHLIERTKNKLMFKVGFNF